MSFGVNRYAQTCRINDLPLIRLSGGKQAQVRWLPSEEMTVEWNKTCAISELERSVTVRCTVTSVESHFGGQCRFYTPIAFAFRSLTVERTLRLRDFWHSPSLRY